MSVWAQYPVSYRQDEIQYIASAVNAGESVAVVGLSGAGKSNLLGFMVNRQEAFPAINILVDCNRLQQNTVDSVFRLIRGALGDNEPVADEVFSLYALLDGRLKARQGSLCILFDRFEILSDPTDQALLSNLRALRDTYKYALTFVTASRRPPDPYSELAELFYAHTLWLGVLSRPDAIWNVRRYAHRVGQTWRDSVQEQILDLTWGYPSLLRAVCQAYSGGASLDLSELRSHPAVRRRVDEFWRDSPSQSDLDNAGLLGHPLLAQEVGLVEVDTAQLTAKELLLWEYLRSHPEQVCAKDDLIRAVWPEDQIYEQGIRDDSLAQLVRRLRVKVEPDPSQPRFIHTIPGRGYLFKPADSVH